MVEATPITKNSLQTPQTVTNLRRYQSGLATVSTNETITTDVGTITANGHAVFKASDGSVVTHTVATNQITITQSLADELVYWFVVGATP